MHAGTDSIFSPKLLLPTVGISDCGDVSRSKHHQYFLRLLAPSARWRPHLQPQAGSREMLALLKRVVVLVAQKWFFHVVLTR
jgi:hypothetical protein